MTAEPITDEELMARLREDDMSALAELVGRYQNDLYRFSCHYLKDPERAREMTQETFLRVHSARDRFDVDRSFRPWVLCIARNLCLNEIKRKRAVQMESFEEFASTAREPDGGLSSSPGDTPDELAMVDERLAFLDRVMSDLDDESREILVLRFFERMSAREIGDVIGSKEGAVRTKLHRILKSLRKRYAMAREDL